MCPPKTSTSKNNTSRVAWNPIFRKIWCNHIKSGSPAIDAIAAIVAILAIVAIVAIVGAVNVAIVSAVTALTIAMQ